MWSAFFFNDGFANLIVLFFTVIAQSLSLSIRTECRTFSNQAPP
jgi:hypothetical protein